MASVDTAGAGELGGLIQALVADSIRRTRRSRPAKYAKVRYFLGVMEEKSINTSSKNSLNYTI